MVRCTLRQLGSERRLLLEFLALVFSSPAGWFGVQDGGVGGRGTERGALVLQGFSFIRKIGMIAFSALDPSALSCLKCNPVKPGEENLIC